MVIQTTFEAFLREVAQLSDAKQQFLEVQEEMAASATNPALVARLRQHLAQTEQQRANLDRVINLYREQDLIVTSHAARGLARDVREIMDAARPNAIRDWLIAQAADTILHAEIAYSANLIATATQLGLPGQVTVLLQQNLEQDQQHVRHVEQLAPQLLQTAIQRSGG